MSGRRAGVWCAPRRWFATFAAVAFCLASPPPSLAQEVTADAWTIGYRNLPCALARQVGDAGTPVLLLTISTADDDETLAFFSPDAMLPVTGDGIEIDLIAAATTTIRAPAESVRTPTNSVYYRPEEAGFLDAVGRSRAMRLRGFGPQVLELSAPTPAAIAAIRACHESALQSWGIDLEERRRLQRPPRLDRAVPMVASGDYPSSAIRAAAQGTVRARISVSPEGRVAACEVVSSSGNLALDVTTCRLARERAQFEPALDNAGRPVAADTIHTVTWTLAE